MSSLRTVVALSLLAAGLASGGALASEWLIYDNGSESAGTPGSFQGVLFELPDAGEAALLEAIAVGSSGPGNYIFHFTESDHLTAIADPIAPEGIFGGINEVDVSALGIVVPATFFIVVEKVGDGENTELDDQANAGRSFWGESLMGLTSELSANLILRARVAPRVFWDGFESGNMLAWTVP